DKEGRLVTENQGGIVITGRTYTAFGEISTVTRGTATTTFDYDRMGRLSKATDAMGFVEGYDFNAFGDRISLTSKLGASVVTHYGYDRRGLLTVETLPMSSTRADGTIAADSVTNRFEYDARGNRITRIEADGLVEERTTRYKYDAADRLIETRHDAVTALSQTDHTTPSTVTPLEKYSYDRRGNVTEIAAVHESGGIATTYSRTLLYYDLLNRKTEEINPFGAYTSYDYDDNGNLISTKAYGTAVALPATAGGPPPPAPAGTPRQTTHSYDKLNRLKTTNIVGVRTGAWTTSSYATADNQTVTTELTYDSRGNVILARDGNGGLVYSYYDKANRKTDQVDQEGYYTKWTLDSEGNVLSECRYDNRASGYTTATKPTVTPDSVNDRVTNFSYDRNGRRLSETRTGVIAWVNGTGNALAAAGTASLVEYEYNALGQVTKKTEATLDAVDYTYDNAGRLIQETRAAYTNSSGVSVRPTVRYYYDGLNNLTRTRQGGTTTTTGDRITRYTYGAGGRLATMTDAANNAYTYYYDAAGNRVRESYSRLKADGTSSADSVLYVRDKLGRTTSQRIATWTGTGWANGDSRNIAYNLYGEVSQRGLNGLWQEKFAYDLAGRLWRTNSGDGVWRYFVHDGNGNQTLAIESEGADMADMALTDAIALAKGTGATVGAVYVDNVNAAITAFDKRGQATKTILPFRQLNSTTEQTLITSRLYNAFGEVAQETDARNYTTNFVYNTIGRLIEQKSPTVSWTSEAGVAADARPTESYYYDLSGRLIGSRAANQTQAANGAATGGLMTTRRLLAGTGYGGTEALVSVEYRADGSDWRTWYDVYGDARKLRNGLATSDDPTVAQTAADELRNYDAMGRLTSVEHRGRLLTDYYAYDLHGQRIKHWNNFPGTPDVETTDYDRQGRVTTTTAFGGDTTTTVHAWDASITNAGVSGSAQIGGWIETTTFENGRKAIEKSDIFDRLLSKTDLGSHVFTFGYDKAGRMTSRGGGEALSYSWLNTGLIASMSTTTGNVASNNWSSRSTTYGYDAAGHVTSERTVDEGEESYQFYWNPSEPDIYYNSWSNVTQNATAAYDALGRMTSWSEAGSTATPAASIAWQYDLNGNIRRSNASYRKLDLNGAASSTATVQDQWSRYDAMDRVVSAKGVDYTYDSAGQRKTAARTERVAVQILVDESIPSYRTVYYDLDTLETYNYRADGALLDVRIAADQVDEGSGTVTAGSSQLRASYTSDALGRLTRQIDWLGNGTDAAYDRRIVYNAKGQAESEELSNKQYSDGSWNTYTSYVTNSFGAGGAYALGAVVTVTSSNWKNGVDSGSNGAKDTYTTNSFAWYDGAVTSQIVYDSESGSSTNPLWTTTYVYNGAGQLGSAQIDDGRRRSVTWTNDLTGQALRRDEADSLPGGDPHEIWYRFGGKQLGYVGNNGTLDTDYATSIDNRTKAPPTNPGAFRF
ncbi:MAG TPA: hypothetical protein VEA60_07410, partial [Allosphingosinicella sp.]|nr:hypothetical protein [Allosphingosinicella sp.]